MNGLICKPNSESGIGVGQSSSLAPESPELRHARYIPRYGSAFEIIRALNEKDNASSGHSGELAK